jgi:hypothetical protein
MDIEERLRGIKDKQGNNLYDHINNILGKLVEDHPNDPQKYFEEYSYYVRHSKYSFTDTKNYLNASQIRDPHASIAGHIDKLAKYFVSPSNSGFCARVERRWH